MLASGFWNRQTDKFIRGAVAITKEVLLLNVAENITRAFQAG